TGELLQHAGLVAIGRRRAVDDIPDRAAGIVEDHGAGEDLALPVDVEDDAAAARLVRVGPPARLRHDGGERRRGGERGGEQKGADAETEWAKLAGDFHG